MSIARELLAAYEATDYLVTAHSVVIARPGERSDAIDGLLAEAGVRMAAVLTAWNPFSTETIPAENARAQAQLCARIDALGLRRLPAEGRGRDGAWPPEESICVLGIALDEARHLAAEFRQNAILWLESGLPARVVVTR